MNAETTRVRLTDGRAVSIPSSIVDRFRGLDAEGHVVVADGDGMMNPDGSEYLYGLTKCCFASAKGCEDGIACRACYQDCSDSLGGPATLTVWVKNPADLIAERAAKLIGTGTPQGKAWRQARAEAKGGFVLTDLQAVEPEHLPRDAGVAVTVQDDLDSMGLNRVDLEASSREQLVEYVRAHWGDEDGDWFREYVEQRIEAAR